MSHKKDALYTHTNMAAFLSSGRPSTSSFPYSRLLKFPLLAALCRRKAAEEDEDEEDEEGQIKTSLVNAMMMMMMMKTPPLRWSRRPSVTTTRKKKRRIKYSRTCPGSDAGRVLAIVGPSGAGKTSLLNALARVEGRRPGRII